MARSSPQIEAAYRLAHERYQSIGVNTDKALAALARIPIALHCWQGDDVGGFEHLEESSGQSLGGGLAVTGYYPGKARNPTELRADIDKTLLLIPGKHRLNLHACYGEYGGMKVDRDEIEASHFHNWIAWAKEKGLGLDFNPTCFAHRHAADGFTLSHADKSIRQFWVEHCRRSREIGAAFGRTLGTPCVTNVWVPDGFKDTPADRTGPRERLAGALDEVFKTPLSQEHNLDAVEPKLFGIGAESCTVGSAEFYLGYCITRNKLLCLDAGHYHPTETISDKISSVLLYLPKILLHVSRGVRWDSDHVVTLSDDLLGIAREIIAADYGSLIHIGLDYFDASINRIAAWTIGMRNMIKALLIALLEPPAIRERELCGDLTARLMLQEEAKSMPFGAVWDWYCQSQGVPIGVAWLDEVRIYEEAVMGKRF